MTWDSLKEYIRQLEAENADLQQQLAMANDYIEQKKKDQYR